MAFWVIVLEHGRHELFHMLTQGHAVWLWGHTMGPLRHQRGFVGGGWQTLGATWFPGIRKLVDLIFGIEEIQGELRDGQGSKVSPPGLCLDPGPPILFSDPFFGPVATLHNP